MKRKENISKVKEEPATKKVRKFVAFDGVEATKPPVHQSTKSNKKKVVKRKFEKSSDPKKNEKPKISGVKNKQVSQDSSAEKPDWREFKKEKKELKEKRKSKRLSTVYDVSVKAKQISEKLRRADCTADDREKLTTKLYKLFEGNFNKLVLTHDMSRVIQWLIKYSSPELRHSIVKEIKSSLLSMFQSKYAKNCVKKGLKYGSDEIREDILFACNGHIVKLVSHTVASPILDVAYKTWATEQTKIHFKQEFYGDMYKRAKDDQIKTLTDVFKNASDMKSATLAAVKLNLVRVLNKNIVTSAIVQSVLVEFLAVCSAEDRSELIVMLRNSIFELSVSKDGAKIAMTCIWYGTTKDRKLSLKAIKDHAKDIAVSEYGHLILMAMFDAIDDTVLIKKILIPEVLSDLQDIVASEYGKKVILYLVARRNTQHFHPTLIAQLKEGDGNATSKKPADIREKELREAVIDSLLEAIANDTTTWLANSSIAMVTLAILKAGHGEKLKEAFSAIGGFLTNSTSLIRDENSEYKVVEHPGLHMMLKKLIVGDKILLEKGESTFGEALIKQLDGPTIEQWSEFNRACFLLVLLLENESESVISSLMPKLKAATQTLKCKKHPGSSILLKKIK